MTLTPLEAATRTTPAATATQDKATSDGAAITSNFDTFLRMLTEQLSNQDPLDPMKSEDFAVQIATFSSVEQQVRTNELLQSIAGDGLSDIARLIGMEARAAVGVEFSGAPITVFPKVADDADAAVLVVMDASGTVVDRQAFESGADEIAWDGTDPEGNPLAHGFYSFAVESRNGTNVLDTSPAESWGRITEATLGADGPVLVFADGTTLPASDLSTIRAPLG